jgi:hypothetical protein
MFRIFSKEFVMTLSEKITNLYPSLTADDFINKLIVIQNDSDGKGDYIAKWEHPTLAKPTNEELA